MNLEDLLGRRSRNIDLKKSLKYIEGKRVLITGAGGSIGSEISRQALLGGAERLYLLGHGESSIFEINRALRKLQDGGYGTETKAIVPIIGEIQDRNYIFYLLKSLSADFLFHTAAHKHVSLGERNPIEVIKNNVFGTKNLIDASKKYIKEKFILISTDKAVEPTSIYGASKMIAEELAMREDGKFLIVRFGNVMDSTGSVVPIFKNQIQNNEPLTITHPEVKRFFLSIQEAVSLILRISGVGKTDELYVLDMGEPIKIEDLARVIAKHYGNESPEVVYTGLCFGEKLEEKLWSDKEKATKTNIPGILRIRRNIIFDNLDELLDEIFDLCFYRGNIENYRNRRILREVLKKHIPTIPYFEEQEY